MNIDFEKVLKQAETVYIELIKLLFDITEAEKLIRKDIALVVEQIVICKFCSINFNCST